MPCFSNNVDDSVAVLLLVQRNADSGSPRVIGSIRFSSIGPLSGGWFSYRRWPAPPRREPSSGADSIIRLFPRLAFSCAVATAKVEHDRRLKGDPRDHPTES